MIGKIRNLVFVMLERQRRSSLATEFARLCLVKPRFAEQELNDYLDRLLIL